MSNFTETRFAGHIADVDEDLRLMALFDLREYINKTTNPSVTNSIVVKSVQCLTEREQSLAVRQEAVTTLPPLAGVCPPVEQWIIIDSLLSIVTAPTPSADHRVKFLELQELCGLTLKAALTTIVGNSQRDVACWQEAVATMNQFAARCAAVLAEAKQDTTRETVYSTLNMLIPVFGNALTVDCVDRLLKQSFADARGVPNLRRLTVPCVAALAPFASAAVLTVVAAAVAAAVRDKQADSADLHLQLCEALMGSDPVRLGSSVGAVVASLSAGLVGMSEDYDASPDTADSALRILRLAFTNFSGHVPAAAHASALAACEQLAAFDPHAAAAAAAAAAGDYGEAAAATYEDADGYQDDYYDTGYYGGGTDNTWRLRMGALHVVAAMAATSTDAVIGWRALAVASAAVSDRIQDTQMVAFALLTAVATRPYCTPTQIGAETFDLLAAWAANGGDSSSMAALQSIEVIFRSVAGSAEAFGATAVEKLVAIFATPADSTTAAYVVEAATTSRAVLEAMVADGSRATATTMAMVQLATALLAVAAPAAPAAVIHAVAGCNHLLYRVAASAGGAGGQKLSQTATATFAAVLAAVDAGGECRRAAAEALGPWACAAAFGVSAGAALSTLGAALADRPLRGAALQTLAGLPAPQEAARHAPPSLLPAVAALMGDADGGTHRSAARVTVTLVEAGFAFSAAEWTAWTGAAAASIARCQAGSSSSSTAVSATALLAADLEVVAAAAQRQKSADVAARLTTAVVAPAWVWLATQHGEDGAYVDALRHLVALAKALDCRTNAKDALAFLSSCKAPISRAAVAVGAAVPSGCLAEAAGALLSEVEALGLGDVAFALCLAEVARLAPLPPARAEALLSSVQSTASEQVRASGEAGLCGAILNSQNAPILAECIRRATSKEPVPGCYYYLCAVRGAAVASQSAPGTGLSSAAQCRSVVESLLAHATEGDFVDLTASCVAALAAAHPSACTKAVVDVVRSGAEGLNVLCAASMRLMLPSVAARPDDLAAVKDVVMNNLCTFLSKTSSPFVPIKTAVIRLLTAQPAWMEGNEAVFRHLVVELRKNDKLVRNFEIGSGFSSRTDKGLEMRRAAFKCVGAVFESDGTGGTRIVEASGGIEGLATALINASGSARDGEADDSIARDAKLLLVTFFQQYPTYTPTREQMTLLCAKFRDEFNKCEATVEESKKTQLTYTVFVITRLARQSFFFHHTEFSHILASARQSSLLPIAAKMHFGL